MGRSVNSGIAKDQFMGFNAKLSFPTIDSIAKRVSKMKGEIWLFKVDLSGYFRQLPLDPGDYSLVCFTWHGKLYFDLVSPMGLRSAPYFAQRTSNAIRHIHNSLGYYLFNYIDDFIGVEHVHRIWKSFSTFTRTLRDLGVKESVEKRVRLTQMLNCVGTLVNTKNLTLTVLPERLEALMGELSDWEQRISCSLKDVQRIIGKLQFVCAVVRPGRVFLARMLEFLCNMPYEKRSKITADFRRDIRWWRIYLPQFNGTCVLWMTQVKKPGETAASDSCLMGMGAISGN